MSGIQRRRLADGTDVIWAVPLSGMGHVADEQPQPYLHRCGMELTPRFGGEELHKESGITSLPLPYGYLSTQWPWRQRLFNLQRRRINIYWKNIFRDFTRTNRFFHFLEQLDFSETTQGFVGTSPTLIFQRTFEINENSIDVIDTIEFKLDLQFSELYLCPWAELKEPDSITRCRIKPTLTENHTHTIQSATGAAYWHAYKVSDTKYKKGDRMSWAYNYQIE